MNDELHRLLAAAPALERATGVRVVVIGGVARGNWAQPRNTEDVDVLVDTDRLEPFIAAAPQVGLMTVPQKSTATFSSRVAVDPQLSSEQRIS